MGVELAEWLRPLAEFKNDVGFGDHIELRLEKGRSYIGFNWGSPIDLIPFGYSPPESLCGADVILCPSNFSLMRDMKEELSGLRLEDGTLDGVRVLGYSVLSRAKEVVDL